MEVECGIHMKEKKTKETNQVKDKVDIEVLEISRKTEMSLCVYELL